MKMRFNIPYDKRDKITPDVLAKLRLISNIVQDPHTNYGWSEIEGDIEKVVDLIGPVEVTGRMTPWITNQLFDISERLQRLEVQQIETHSQTFNQRVNVHVPGLGLLLLNEIKVMEDACTDNIQKELNAGWRIVAVCPQPDSRRPDYILGRKRGEDVE